MRVRICTKQSVLAFRASREPWSAPNSRVAEVALLLFEAKPTWVPRNWQIKVFLCSLFSLKSVETRIKCLLSYQKDPHPLSSESIPGKRNQRVTCSEVTGPVGLEVGATQVPSLISSLTEVDETLVLRTVLLHRLQVSGVSMVSEIHREVQLAWGGEQGTWVPVHCSSPLDRPHGSPHPGGSSPSKSGKITACGAGWRISDQQEPVSPD